MDFAELIKINLLKVLFPCRRQREVEQKQVEELAARRVEELVAKRVEEELERRKDEIEAEVLRRVEEAKRLMEEQMLEELEKKKKEQEEEQRKREVRMVSRRVVNGPHLIRLNLLATSFEIYCDIIFFAGSFFCSTS